MELSNSKFKKSMLWVTLFLAIASSFLIFWYTDIGDTLDNGVLLVESIVNGEFTDYYEYAALNSAPQSAYSANYNVLLYAIFAIWNMPTAIIHLNTGFDYIASVPACIWCKSIIVFALVLTVCTVRKITKKLGGSYEDCLIAGFLSVSSLSVMVPALVASQYDCLSLLFMLLGIMFYADGKDKLFVIMFAIAVPLKLFAIFIFIPMILLRHKNVLKLLFMMVAVMLPSYLVDLPFKANPYYKVAMDSQNSDAMDLLLKANVSIGELKVNLFFIAYIIICFICYMKHEDDRIKETHLAVYYSFAVFSAFCALIPIRSYWIILFTPFLAILVALKKENKVISIIADTLAGLGCGMYFLIHHWIYNTGTIAGNLLLFGTEFPEGYEQKYGSIKGLLEDLGLADFKYVFFAVFIGAVIFSLWHFYPNKKVSDKTHEINTGTTWILFARPLILIAVVAVLLYCQFATIPVIKYGLANYKDKMEINIMDGTVVSDYIVFDNDEKLTSMTLHLDTSAYRSARAFVGVRMYEANTENIIFEDSIGIVLIENDRAEFDLDGLKVQRGKMYKLELYPVNSELSEGGTVYPYIDSEGKLGVTFR